jgi:hypothetical protein
VIISDTIIVFTIIDKRVTSEYDTIQDTRYNMQQYSSIQHTNMKERRRVKNQNSEKDIYLVEITLTAILVRVVESGNWWKASSVTTKPLSTLEY